MQIAFFNQLKEDTDVFFRSAAEFLCIDPALGGRRADKAVGKAMSVAVREHLRAQSEGEIRTLAGPETSPYPEQWYESSGILDEVDAVDCPAGCGTVCL